MELPVFSLPLIQGFLICLARVAAMFAAIPVFSGGQIPPQLRLGVAVLFSNGHLPGGQKLHPGTDFFPDGIGALDCFRSDFGAAGWFFWHNWYLWPPNLPDH